MTRFTGYPLYTPMVVELDKFGRPKPDEGKQQFAQGWIQHLASTSDILQGNWEHYTTDFLKFSATQPTKIAITETPWGLDVFVSFGEAVSQTVTLPNTFTGVLQSTNGDFFVVDGTTFTLTTTSACTIFGRLQTEA